MATARLRKVDEFLTCTICYDMYTDPCTLTCQHTFCRKCVTQYIKTRPEAFQTKTIPCPSCRQVTKVPAPTEPVEKWAWQIKPSIIILGLIDTSDYVPTTPEGHSCDMCKHIGETTPATSWCPQCEVALCERCTKIHRASPASRDHDVSVISTKVKASRKSKPLCREHKKNYIQFHCKDCKRPACHRCCFIYHSACKSVLNIESMREEMISELLKKRDVLGKNLEKKTVNLEGKRHSINVATKNKVTLKSKIRSVSQKAMDKIKQKETQLMNKLDEATEKQLSQLQADVKTEEIDEQMYRQHCEFIDQAVNSECVMDMYHMYQACESGVLELGDIRKTITEDRTQEQDITFTHDHNKLIRNLDSLQLGVLTVTYQEISTSALMSSPVLIGTTDMRTDRDKGVETAIDDVVVLDVDGMQTVVMSDWNNMCLKCFYWRNNKPCLYRLALPEFPHNLTRVKKKHIMVTLSREIITVKVTPRLVQLSSIKTVKEYFGLALINKSSLAAGAGEPDCCVDILNMAGHVMKSVRTYNGKELFHNPRFICINIGNIVVSDWGSSKVTCLTGEGDFLWQYPPKDDRELIKPICVTSTENGDILVSDNSLKKVIQLRKTGEFAGNVLTSANGLECPMALFFTQRGSLFVCDGFCDKLKQFSFVGV